MWPHLLLVALAFGVYANALGNGFVSDDNSQLLANPLVTNWRLFFQIFLHNNWAFTGQQISNYYRPIQAAFYLLLYYAFGFNAFIFHLVMVLIHVANTLLIYRLARRWLPSDRAALVAGILFAVHPIHSEAVVWIAVLPDVLLTFVALTALGLFVRWEAAPRRGQIAVLAALYFLALLTKEPGAMLAPLLAGYEFFFLGRPVWRRTRTQPGDQAPMRPLRDNWEFYASLTGVFGIYALLRIHALGGFAPSQGGYNHLHGKVLLLSVISILGEYLGGLVAPIHLNYFHFFEATTSVTATVLVSLTAEVGIVAAIFLLRNDGAKSDSALSRNLRLISYGLFFLLVSLAPALNINGVGENVVAERYLYFPSVGFVIVAAAVWEWLAAKQPRIAWSVVAALVVASIWLVVPRNRDWHDDLRLLTVSVAASPKSATLLGNLGSVEAQRGDYDAAIQTDFKALQTPAPPLELALFHYNLGSAYLHQGRNQDAVSELEKAIALKSDYAEARVNLGIAREALGDIPGAIAAEEEALALRPNYGEAYNELALLRIRAKDYPAAITLLQRALAVNSRHTEAYINLGTAYNGSHRFQEASEAFRKAIEVDPGHPSIYIAHYDLGLSYSHLNSLEAAALEFSKALQLRPDYAPARDALAQTQNMLQQQPRANR